jgi:outer membrane receptor protein involved in Fe transport
MFLVSNYKKAVMRICLKVIAPVLVQVISSSYNLAYTQTDSIQNINNKSDIKKPSEVYTVRTPKKYDYTLSGIIKDKNTGEALPFAIVAIKGLPGGVSSNVDGYFTLFHVPSDTCAIFVSSIGYKPAVFYLSSETPVSNLILELTQNVINLDEVVVTSIKNDLVLSSKDEISQVNISPKKIAELPNVGEKDIMRSLQLMPGISASKESSSGLYVLGGTPDQNLILYDGFTVYHVDHLYGFYSAFNSNAVKDINLYKGGFEAKYGGRLSSVTDITGKDGNQKNISGGVDVSLLSVNAYLEVPIDDNFSSIFAFRRSYQGLLYDKIFDKLNTTTSTTQSSFRQGSRYEATTQSTVASYFYDLNGKLTYRPTSNDVISLSIYNGADNLDNSSNPGSFDGGRYGEGRFNANLNSDDVTDFGNFGSSLKWSKKWNNNFYSNTLVSYSTYYSSRDLSSQATITSDTSSKTIKSGVLSNNNLKDISLKSNFEWQATENNKIEFGYQATKLNVKFNYSTNDTSTIINTNNQTGLFALYLQDKIKVFNNKLTILPGIRSTWYGLTSKMYYEPRFMVNYQLVPKIKLSASVGQFYQFANRVVLEDISNGTHDFWVLSDGIKVPVGSAIHYITGISYENDGYLFSTEAYYKALNGITQYSMEVEPIGRKLDYEENFYNGRGYADGIEFLIQKKTGDFNGWVSYTLSQARDQFNAYGSNYFPALQDVRNEFKIVGIYRLGRWCFSGNWIYASGTPYTPPTGAYSLTMLDGTTQSFVAIGAENSARLPDYHRLDLAASYDFKYWEKRKNGSISFSVFNVYNRTNIWYKQYQVIQGVLVENNVDYLGITPNIILTLKF